MQVFVIASVLLATLLLALSLVYISGAHPAQPAEFVSVPITKMQQLNITDIDPAIVHQLNINQGLKRRARLSGRAEPSPQELLWNVYRWIPTTLPASGKRYSDEGIGESPTGSKPPVPKINQTLPKHVPDGYGKVESDAYIHHTVSKAKTPTVPHTVGLDIQWNNFGYIATVQIGTPARDFQLQVDTGSADLWVGAEGCVSEWGGSCGKHTFLGPKSSFSFSETKDPWSDGYVGTGTSGLMANDDVTIAGLTLKAHKFGVAHKERGFGHVPFDGILGLGKSFRGPGGQYTPTLVESLQIAGLIKEAVVSFNLPRLSDGKDDGEMTLGAMNPDKYNAKSLVTVKAVKAAKVPRLYWEAAIDSVKANGKDTAFKGKTAIFDTGYSHWVVPDGDAKLLHKFIPGSKYEDKQWFIPCTTDTSFSFSFGGKEFTVYPRDLAYLQRKPNQPKGDCYSAVISFSPHSGFEKNQWILGTVFLKDVYFSTNVIKDTISLAKLAD